MATSSRCIISVERRFRWVELLEGNEEVVEFWVVGGGVGCCWGCCCGGGVETKFWIVVIVLEVVIVGEAIVSSSVGTE